MSGVPTGGVSNPVPTPPPPTMHSVAKGGVNLSFGEMSESKELKVKVEINGKKYTVTLAFATKLTNTKEITQRINIEKIKDLTNKFDEAQAVWGQKGKVKLVNTATGLVAEVTYKEDASKKERGAGTVRKIQLPPRIIEAKIEKWDKAIKAGVSPSYKRELDALENKYKALPKPMQLIMKFKHFKDQKALKKAHKGDISTLKGRLASIKKLGSLLNPNASANKPAIESFTGVPQPASGPRPPPAQPGAAGGLPPLPRPPQTPAAGAAPAARPLPAPAQPSPAAGETRITRPPAQPRPAAGLPPVPRPHLQPMPAAGQPTPAAQPESTAVPTPVGSTLRRPAVPRPPNNPQPAPQQQQTFEQSQQVHADRMALADISAARDEAVGKDLTKMNKENDALMGSNAALLAKFKEFPAATQTQRNVAEAYSKNAALKASVEGANGWSVLNVLTPQEKTIWDERRGESKFKEIEVASKVIDYILSPANFSLPDAIAAAKAHFLG